MSKQNKRRKNFYVQCTKRPKHNVLTTGIRGILVSCNLTQSYQEKRCIMEAYNILNEYADKLCGPEKALPGEMSLEEELQELRSIGVFEPRRFQQLYTAVPNCLFVQTQLENPCSLVLSILEDLEKSHKQKTRYCLRMFPTLLTCKPYLENMQKGIVEAINIFSELFPEYKEKETISYMILFKARNNHTLQKDTVVRYLNDAIRGMEKKRLEPELRNPDLVLSIDILHLVCCLSVMPNYFRYKKYNLVELAKSKTSAPEGQAETSGKDSTEKPATDTEASGKKDTTTDGEGTEKASELVEASAKSQDEVQVTSQSDTGMNVDSSRGSGEATEEGDETKDVQEDDS